MAHRGQPVRAKKGLSQNFLTCPNMARKLVSSLAPFSSRVIEAGPGTGALTKLLVESADEVIAIELDERCYSHLQTMFPDKSNLTLILGSILEYDFFSHSQKDPFSFLSNLPYGITTPVILHLMNSRYPFPRIVVTMQKEVAERLTAGPGTRLYGRLSVMLALYGRIGKLFDLPPSVFEPSPSVMSTAVEIIPEQDRWISPELWKDVVRFVKAAFCQRRKKIVNSLASGLALHKDEVTAIMVDNGFDPALRAEKITPEEYVSMARCFQVKL
jgi:16S rRNA (adenine1518-N6/adenine1519-N6)-dimethyltransferase